MKADTLDQSLTRVFIALCEKADTVLSLKCSILVRYQQWEQLLSLRVNPAHYETAEHYRDDNACVEFFRKCHLPVTGHEKIRKAQALETFWASEKMCARTNVRFANLIEGYCESNLDSRAMEILLRAKNWLATVLGRLPDDLNGRFGPGATFGDRGRHTTIPDKMTSRPDMTSDVSPYIHMISGSAWFRYGVSRRSGQDYLNIIRGNRFTTVPKDSLKDRGICIEPSINIYLQLAVGDLLKDRCKRAGVNLLYAQDSHRLWAQRASLHGSHATIDLTAASDTVALNLVKFLLPDSWYGLMSDLRSPFTFVEGRWVKLNKFSSMGNGYTFELETLIFASLAFACNSGEFGTDFSVFGDDIIVPSSSALDVLAILRYCGFEPNKRKTFLTGRFRESCGGDYFDGKLVRGFNLSAPPSQPSEWITLANGLRRLGSSDPDRDFRSSTPFTAWLRCLDALPVVIRRLRGPHELGDLVIHDDNYTRRWDANGIGWIRVFRPVSRPVPWHHFRSGVILASALYGLPSSGVIPRGSVSGYKVDEVAFS